MIDMDWSPQTPRDFSGTPAITVTMSRPQPDTTVCTITGAVDWNTRALVKDALTHARHDDNAHLVIDLFGVTSMDSAGPYTLLEARVKHHLSGGGHLAVITHPSSRAIPKLPVWRSGQPSTSTSLWPTPYTPAPTPIPVPAIAHQKQLHVRLRLPTRRARHLTVAVFWQALPR
jgi:anti-anti-sigma factor